MSERKKLQDLTIRDNFLFAAVMLHEDACRTFLEMTLGFPIRHVEISQEKNIIYHPEYKGVRLDVFASVENNTHYDIEMQVASRKLEKRSRYYHSQMDMEMLLSGKPYDELSDAYVIFICDFDPFGKSKYRYTFDRVCREDSSLTLEDGSHTIFLSTAGKNMDEVPPEMIRFLKFVKADLKESQEDFGDAYVAKLQKLIKQIKKSRQMEERYMLFQEMLRDEREQGKVEGKIEGKVEDIFEFLSEMGEVSEELHCRIMSIKDPKKLTRLSKAAARAGSIEQFMEALAQDDALPQDDSLSQNGASPLK